MLADRRTSALVQETYEKVSIAWASVRECPLTLCGHLRSAAALSSRVVKVPTSSEERARLIATADMVLEDLKGVRSRQPATADVEIVERWIARVAGVRENLDAITDWSSAEVYSGNALDPGEALRRLFPDVLADGDFDHELARLEAELARLARTLQSRRDGLSRRLRHVDGSQ